MNLCYETFCPPSATFSTNHPIQYATAAVNDPITRISIPPQYHLRFENFVLRAPKMKSITAVRIDDTIKSADALHVDDEKRT